MDFKFERPRMNKISTETITNELEKAAKVFNYVAFGKRDFDKVANIHHATVVRQFGSWNSAISFLKKHLEAKRIELLPRKKGYFTEKDLFKEMERIWLLIGHRPSKDEWFVSNPKYSYATYRRYFNGWTNACLKFIEHKMGQEITDDVLTPSETIKKDKNRIKYKPEDSRTIPLGIRLKVLSKDNFRCIFCGRSPATDIGVKLHIDHIVPFSKGGLTIIENLQTLCFDCNLGKSSDNIRHKREL